MKIGVIGPTKVDMFCSLKGFMKDAYMQYIRYVAFHLANSSHEIYIVPDKGSSAEAFGKFYREAGGQNLSVFCPLDDTEFGHDWLNVQVGNHVINSKTWRNQPEEFTRIRDVLLCFGIGVGSLIEICYTKWYNVHKVYLLKEFVPRLPPEVAHKLHLTYITTEQVVKELSDGLNQSTSVASMLETK